MKTTLFVVLWTLLCIPFLEGAVISITDYGAVADVKIANQTNRDAFNSALSHAQAGDIVLIPNGTWYFVGGVQAAGLESVTIQFDGTIEALDDFDSWSLTPDGTKYEYFLTILDSTKLTLTSSKESALLNGHGHKWWDYFILGFFPHGDMRPRFVCIQNSTDVLIEKLHLVNSPSWHLVIRDCARVEVRYVQVEVDKDYQRELKSLSWKRKRELAIEQIEAPLPQWLESILQWLLDQGEDLIPPFLLQPEDLNTDGIDPSGTDMYIHDCIISNDDDSIAIKPSSSKSVHGPCTQNILLENLSLQGFGASIGSVPPNSYHNCVRNITFRNISMPDTGKGIYIKSNPSCEGGVNKTSEISQILYENVTITRPWWWAIWIGPQQQQEPGQSLGEKCSLEYPLQDHCPTQGCTTFRDITFRNVLITDPLMSPGVLLGNSTNPMQNITFDNVVVKKTGTAWPKYIEPFAGTWPFNSTYQCEFISGTVKNSSPKPACFG